LKLLWFITLPVWLAANSLPLYTYDEIISLENQEDLCNTTGFVLRIDPGQKIPLRFVLDGSVFSFEGDGNIGTLTAKQTTYIKFVFGQDEDLLFSLDGVNWKEFEEIFTGKTSVMLTQESTHFGFELNYR